MPVRSVERKVVACATQVTQECSRTYSEATRQKEACQQMGALTSKLPALGDEGSFQIDGNLQLVTLAHPNALPMLNSIY